MFLAPRAIHPSKGFQGNRASGVAQGQQYSVKMMLRDARPALGVARFKPPVYRLDAYPAGVRKPPRPTKGIYNILYYIVVFHIVLFL